MEIKEARETYKRCSECGERQFQVKGDPVYYCFDCCNEEILKED